MKNQKYSTPGKPPQKDEEHHAVQHSPEIATRQLRTMIGAALGIKAPRAADHLISQVAGILSVTRDSSADETLLAALETVKAFVPTNLAEALLAAQTVGVHEATIQLLRRASLPNQSVESVNGNVTAAFRLGRLFIEQLEAMAKLKGKTSEQRVTVEHVHVHPGGQAIVGAVTGPPVAGRGAGDVEPNR